VGRHVHGEVGGFGWSSNMQFLPILNQTKTVVVVVVVEVN